MQSIISFQSLKTGLFFFFILFFGCLANTAQSETDLTATSPEHEVASGNLMFILDASGSMWGQVEGRAKIEIAKEVLTDLIKGLPDDAVAGLVAYGHRRKGDCNDVEELIALGPLNKQAMIAQVQKLNPKGKTPISRSVRLTAEKIKHLEDETTIILISDGKETCDPDPCGLVKDLKASGIKF
ncbi:MAG: VWA domain-containing protein, partial [Desulfobacteraceae bacterium]|nr:VWA domain-containing protein [Desulfobacteraceae bacterium]